MPLNVPHRLSPSGPFVSGGDGPDFDVGPHQFVMNATGAPVPASGSLRDASALFAPGEGGSLEYVASTGRVRYVGSTDTITFDSGGDLGTVDISGLDCGGCVRFTNAENYIVRAFTAKPPGFWFDCVLTDSMTRVRYVHDDATVVPATARMFIQNNRDYLAVSRGNARLRYNSLNNNRWMLTTSPGTNSISVTPPGALGVVDISALAEGGLIITNAPGDFSLDGFTAGVNRQRFSFVIPGTFDGVGTLNNNVGNAVTAIRTPNGLPFHFVRGQLLDFEYTNNRWFVNGAGEVPTVLGWSGLPGGSAGTYTVPENVRWIDAWMVAGGGGGGGVPGGVSEESAGASGGNAGGSLCVSIPVVPGDTFTWSAGAAGTGEVGVAGTAGGSTSMSYDGGSMSYFILPVSLAGGAGGAAGVYSGSPTAVIAGGGSPSVNAGLGFALGSGLVCWGGAGGYSGVPFFPVPYAGDDLAGGSQGLGGRSVVRTTPGTSQGQDAPQLLSGNAGAGGGGACGASSGPPQRGGHGNPGQIVIREWSRKPY